jgi:HNH endonuclease
MPRKSVRAKARAQKPKRTAKPVLTAERLRELIEYCPKTGRMFWRVNRGPARAGSEAGAINGEGRVYIRIDGRLYQRSRLAWLFMRGEHPAQFVDHRSGRRDDDRWENLRLATPSENSRNCRRRVSKHGVPGVGYTPGRSKPWQAQIQRAGKRKSLGMFATKAEASAAYEAAAKREHGAFATSRRPKTESKHYVSFADLKLGDILAEMVLDDIAAEKAATEARP